jgi:7-cyano-7-deazaguanine synthase in queuosine biosynthesis
VDPLRLRVSGNERQLDFAGILPARIVFRGAARQLAWSALGLDLVEVATAVLLADRLVRRTRGGPRSMTLRLGVRRPKAWREAEPLLQHALADLTGDHFAFVFRQGPVREPPPHEHKPLCLDRVALFSGGLDSGAGAAFLAQEPRETGFVTQYSSGIRSHEALLRDIIERYAPGRRAAHASFFIQPSGSLARRMHENTRRSRSFLFVSLALATAYGASAREVCVCENGPLALNLPLSAAMTPTRHAHGQFLLNMERLAGGLFGVPIHVGNPFELMTKGEMTRVFRTHAELALRTRSCWYQQFSGRGAGYGRGHCGHCLPCLVRRVSLEAAGISIPRDHFDVDAAALAGRQRLSKEQARLVTPLRLLLNFAERVQRCRTWKDFVRAFPEAIEHLPTHHREMDSEEWFRGLHQTVKRFAREVADCYGGR